MSSHIITTTTTTTTTVPPIVPSEAFTLTANLIKGPAPSRCTKCPVAEPHDFIAGYQTGSDQADANNAAVGAAIDEITAQATAAGCVVDNFDPPVWT